METTVIAQFKNSTEFLTGLTVLVNVWTVDGTKVLDGEPMAEHESGVFYTHTFTAEENTQYLWVAENSTFTDFSDHFDSGTFTTGTVNTGGLTPEQDALLTNISKLVKSIINFTIRICAKFNIDLSKLGVNINEYK